MADSRLLARGGATALVLALTATACGGDDKKDTAAPTASGSASASSGAAGGIYQASDKKGGDLKILANSDCDSWDPTRAYYASCIDLHRFLFRGLMTFAPKPGPAEVVPDLATAPPEVSDNNKTWKYTIRDNIKYEDGTPVTTKDIKYGVQRAFANDVLSGGPTYVVQELVGGDKYKGPYKNKAGLASIETPDDKTIIFKLKRPFADWNYVMAYPQSAPVPQAKDTGAKYTFKPVATGPYKFQSYTPNKSLKLVRNPEWDPATDQVRKALPDTVTITIGLDLDDIDNRIISNQADVHHEESGVQQAAQAKILTNPALKKRSNNPVTGFLRYLTVFQMNKPFDNIHCRNAVAWVIDKRAQQLARGGPVVGGDIATTMIPSKLKYYTKFDLFPSDGGRGNVEKAKEELKLCGQPNGFNTKIAASNVGKGAKQAEALQADLKKIGINATISGFDASQYYASQIGIPANVRRQNFGMGFAAWGPDWPTPYGFFKNIVDSRAILANGNSNYGELKLPEVDSGIDKGVAATDDATAQPIWTAVDKAIVGSAVYIPLLYDKTLTVVSERTTNVYLNEGYLHSDFVNLGVTP